MSRFKENDKVVVNSNGLRVYTHLSGLIGQVIRYTSESSSLVEFGGASDELWQRWLISNDYLEHAPKMPSQWPWDIDPEQWERTKEEFGRMGETSNIWQICCDTDSADWDFNYYVIHRMWYEEMESRHKPAGPQFHNGTVPQKICDLLNEQPSDELIELLAKGMESEQ